MAAVGWRRLNGGRGRVGNSWKETLEDLGDGLNVFIFERHREDEEEDEIRGENVRSTTQETTKSFACHTLLIFRVTEGRRLRADLTRGHQF